jgi:prevent-host-death family protein
MYVWYNLREDVIMTRLSASKAREHFADILNQVIYKEERIILQRRGKDLVAVVPIADLELLEKLEDQLDIQDAEAALKEIAEKGAIPWEQIKSEEGL